MPGMRGCRSVVRSRTCAGTWATNATGHPGQPERSGTCVLAPDSHQVGLSPTALQTTV